MRALRLALIPIVVSSFWVACSDDTVATTIATSSSSTGGSSTGDPSGDPTSSTTSPTTGPGTSVGSNSATDSGTTSTVTTDATTSTSSSDTGTTVDPSAGTSSTGEPGTTGTTTGGALGCGMDGPELDANLVHLGEDPGCGALEFIGTNASDSSGPVYALDGCPCGANCLKPDPWTLTLDVPMQWLPGKLPDCPRVVVERQKSKQGCELVGVAIWDSQEPGAPARYHAGSLLGPIVAAQAELQTEAIVAEECDCDNCCNTPTRLDLKFSIARKSATLAEGEELLLGGEGDPFSYQIKSFQSHLSGICDDSPNIDWAMLRVTPP